MQTITTPKIALKMTLLMSLFGVMVACGPEDATSSHMSEEQGAASQAPETGDDDDVRDEASDEEVMQDGMEDGQTGQSCVLVTMDGKEVLECGETVIDLSGITDDASDDDQAGGCTVMPSQDGSTVQVSCPGHALVDVPVQMAEDMGASSGKILMRERDDVPASSCPAGGTALEFYRINSDQTEMILGTTYACNGPCPVGQVVVDEGTAAQHCADMVRVGFTGTLTEVKQAQTMAQSVRPYEAIFEGQTRCTGQLLMVPTMAPYEMGEVYDPYALSNHVGSYSITGPMLFVELELGGRTYTSGSNSEADPTMVSIRAWTQEYTQDVESRQQFNLRSTALREVQQGQVEQGVDARLYMNLERKLVLTDDVPIASKISWPYPATEWVPSGDLFLGRDIRLITSSPGDSDPSILGCSIDAMTML